MATFAEYAAATTASSGSDNDFTLYPGQDWSGEQAAYLPLNTYADSSIYPNSTTFDSLPATTSYAPSVEFDFGGFPFLEHSKSNNNHIHAHSPSYSPEHLASHLDYRSGTSVPSTISSAMGSPSMQHQSGDWSQQQVFPGIVQQADGIYPPPDYDMNSIQVIDKNCVDPSLIQPYSPLQSQYPTCQFGFSPPPTMFHAQMPSPAPSKTSVNSPAPTPGHASPFPQSWYPTQRRPSISSVHSRHSSQSHTSAEDANKGQCPLATCGRQVKDLKAHMLTHQHERPEKCPIPTCEYHIKGFARKYDKNRHTLTHYKGTMVCGFCPGSGSAAEKSFNRADVFKRHLTSVHGVEQTPPNARKRGSPATSAASASTKRPFSGVGGAREVSGMCSTCGHTFASAQDFYEHLDDCVLRVVQQADPSEAINEKLLAPMAADGQVRQTLDKNMLSGATADYSNASSTFDEEDGEEDDADEDEDTPDGSSVVSRKSGKKARKEGHVSAAGAICKPTGPRKGLTYSKGGVPLSGPASSSSAAQPATAGKGSKRRKHYPLSWGTAPEQMRMKKRVLCVYEGQRRLWKDDMMLDASHEVRIPLGASMAGGAAAGHGAYVTDLDVQTLCRAEGVLNATEEEKGPWMPEAEEDEQELERLMQ